MDRNKILIPLGIFIFLIVLIWAFTAISGRENPTEVTMRETLIAQETVIEISTIATRRSGNLQTQAISANILSTTTSDRNQLRELYQGTFGAPPTEPDSSAVAEVEEATESFDRVYRSVVEEYLQLSLERLQRLRAASQNEEAQRTLEIAITNHEAHLQSLSEN